MAVTNADILGWLNANPNASPELINQTMIAADVSPAQFQAATGYAPPPVTQASSPQKVATLLEEAPKTQTAMTPEQEAAYIQKVVAASSNPTQLVGGPVQALPPIPTEDAKTALTKQILAQGTTSQWSGEGKGSTEANATDIAGILSSIGITDINQFGQIPKIGSIGVTPQYQYIDTGQSDEYGPVYTTKLIGYTDANGNPVDASKVVDTGEGLIANNVVVGTTYGNKVTGQEVPNTYSERQTGNAFGGTYAGKGNTAYRVDFAPNGTPVFYTTGASSSDIGNIMPIIQLALAATGAGGLLGNAILGAGASEIASGALGNAILGGATSGIAGGDILKGALLGGAGGALGGYLKGGPIDASNMTSAQFNDAIEGQLVKSLQGAGLTNAQIGQWLENASPADIASVTSTIPVTGASDSLLIEAAKNPITATALTDVLSQVPTIAVTGKALEQVPTETINAVNSLLSNNATTATPKVEITAKNPNQPDVPVITPVDVSLSATTTPVVEVTANGPTKSDVPVVTAITPTVTTTTPPVKKDTTLTTSDIIRLISVVPAIAAVSKVVTPNTPTTPQYPIVDIPSGWSDITKTKVAPATTLPPINFGDRNLLIGTQWEKFLSPDYGKVPAPVQYSQPSNLSYNDLMGILGSKQGYPAASNLSINDIISGIQNQYGQTPSSTMG